MGCKNDFMGQMLFQDSEQRLEFHGSSFSFLLIFEP
jgi:hypothetical protein